MRAILPSAAGRVTNRTHTRPPILRTVMCDLRAVRALTRRRVPRVAGRAKALAGEIAALRDIVKAADGVPARPQAARGPRQAAT